MDLQQIIALFTEIHTAELADRHYVVESGVIVEVVERADLKAKAEV